MADAIVKVTVSKSTLAIWGNAQVKSNFHYDRLAILEKIIHSCIKIAYSLWFSIYLYNRKLHLE